MNGFLNTLTEWQAKVLAARTRSLPPWAAAILFGLLGVSLPIMGAILPEERSDVLYHRYEGGGVTVDGPSVLIRKSIGNNLSVEGHYYTDTVSSASVDVISQGSPYTEFREEQGIKFDVLNDNTNISFGYTVSDENDYLANTYHFGVSHGMFGDLTTVSMGYAFGSDNVGKNGDNFSEATERRAFGLGVSQILTKDMILSVAYDAITDDGYLNNPYRAVRLRTAAGRQDCDQLSLAYCYRGETYPGTRTSSAFGARLNYYLPYRAALKGFYRYFSDTWGIESETYELAYTQPVKNWLIDVHYRYYEQTAASFYSGAFEEELVYMASDKELSTFNSTTIGFGLSYEFWHKGWWIFDKGAVSFSYDSIGFSYLDFYQGDLNNLGAPYSFNAEVTQFYISVWY